MNSILAQGKVRIFWEGHNILRILLLSYVVPVKSKVKISQTSSESMNFNGRYYSSNKIRETQNEHLFTICQDLKGL